MCGHLSWVCKNENPHSNIFRRSPGEALSRLFSKQKHLFPTEKFLSAELVESEKLLGATDAL